MVESDSGKTGGQDGGILEQSGAVRNGVSVPLGGPTQTRVGCVPELTDETEGSGMFINQPSPSLG